MPFSGLLEFTSKKGRSADKIKQVTHKNKQGNNLTYLVQSLGLVENPGQENSCLGSVPESDLKRIFAHCIFSTASRK